MYLNGNILYSGDNMHTMSDVLVLSKEDIMPFVIILVYELFSSTCIKMSVNDYYQQCKCCPIEI